MTLFVSWTERPLAVGLAVVLGLIVLVMMAYGIRHIIFTLSRLFGGQRYPYADIDTAQWPQITVFIAAHNEEKVIAGCLAALLETDYPADRIKIVPANDRSGDGTQAIIDRYVALHPKRIVPFHRTGGKPGKAAALKDALAYAKRDIAIIFDADYTRGRGLLRQLATPFFDPEVGAVMGRVVPINAGTNLLTRMLDLERSAGYQVDQQARLLTADQRFRWYTMEGLATFLSRRELAQWNIVTAGHKGRSLVASSRSSLQELSWIFPGDTGTPFRVLKGNATLRQEGTDWIVTAGDCTTLEVQPQ